MPWFPRRAQSTSAITAAATLRRRAERTTPRWSSRRKPAVLGHTISTVVCFLFPAAALHKVPALRPSTSAAARSARLRPGPRPSILPHRQRRQCNRRHDGRQYQPIRQSLRQREPAQSWNGESHAERHQYLLRPNDGQWRNPTNDQRLAGIEQPICGIFRQR